MSLYGFKSNKYSAYTDVTYKVQNKYCEDLALAVWIVELNAGYFGPLRSQANIILDLACPYAPDCGSIELDF